MSTWVSPITWANAAITASQMNVGIRDKMNYLKAALDANGITSDVGKQQITPALCGARAYMSAAQSIPSGGATNLAFNAERFDSDAFHDIAGNPERITIPAAMGGYYLIGATLTWTGNATGYRRLRIIQNATTYLASQSSTPAGTEALLQTLSTVFLLAAGDFVVAEGFQTSGIALNAGGGGPDSGEFWIHRLSST